MSELENVLAHVDASIDDAVSRLFELLRIESISTDSAYDAECQRAADWMVAELQHIGFDAARHPTPGHPMVVAHSQGASAGAEAASSGGTAVPHLLFYGHYDVQPVDPLALWNRAPFDPAIEETPAGKLIRARGAADDKGQLMTFVEACRAWREVSGSLPARVSLFFEGEEESGSPSLIPFMEQNREALTADLALVCDTGMWDARTPAISTMLRGMVGEEVTITGPSRDLHSGMYGGPAMNPVRVLTRILGGLHDEAGRVTLPGFYEGVTELPDDIRAQWQALEHDGDAFLAEVGLSVPAGEAGYSVLEQIWARPSCDINGIAGGYAGEGFKTVLPSMATAKISFRLVGEQDPEAIQASFQQYVRERLPADCTVQFLSKHGAGATTMPTDAPAFARAREALSAEWPEPAVFAGCGGSIPVVGHIKSILGMDSLLIGFGLDDDAIHSPNEKYSLTSFHKGIRSWVRVLEALSAPG